MTSSNGSGPADRRLLTTAEAAARLGVKRQTLYAYVSRGVLHRTVDTDGRTSLFDPVEIDRFAQGRRADDEGELRTLLTTALTRVDDTGLLIRGRDLVALVTAGSRFRDVVELLWDGAAGEAWPSSQHPARHPPAGLDRSLLDELRVIVALASADDPLRHDLTPRSVRAAGRSLITAMAAGLTAPIRPSPSATTPPHPATGPAPSPPGQDLDPSEPAPSPSGPAPVPSGAGLDLVEQLWRRLTTAGATPERLLALDTALALLVDHGLAGSTFAARIAASVRADPYSVVSAGLGVLGGPLHGAASGGVHDLLSEAERSGDPAAAVGAALRRSGRFPGFGHAIYRSQDPRYGSLMARVVTAWADDPRLATVHRVRDLIGHRSDALANIDLALGSLTWLAGMGAEAGEVIFAIGRTAGWLAHAIEEYDETPLRFRARERYSGPVPGR